MKLGRRVDARLAVSAIVLAGYLAAARGVENLYPLSRFEMYAGATAQATSVVLARTADGAFVDPSAFVAWRCDALPSLETTACDGVHGTAYVDRERDQYIRAHAGDGREPVELVRRVFSFDGVARAPYCTIARCAATRR